MNANELLTAAWNRASLLHAHQHKDEFQPFLKWLLDRGLHHVIEIGMLHGGTAAAFAAIASGRVVTIDLPNGRWGGEDHGYNEEASEERNATLTRSYPNLVPLLGDSHDPEMPDRVRAALGGSLADLLFIDGDHSREGLKQDYRLYAPLVRPGGIIAFHDIAPTTFHADQGVDVPTFWANLHGETYTWVGDHPWGGIGAIVV